MKRLLVAAALASTLALTACLAGEDGEASDTVSLDYATYNPLSLVIREKGWLDDALAEQGAKAEWVVSAGSNKANESLRSGTVDVGSTAGSAALLARSNGSPIKVIGLYSRPEWSALVTQPDSGIKEVADLKGRTVAATKGTDPYFFLVQALEEAGLSLDDVTVENLQHADGRTALASGQVDAWAGLDPIMAAAEAEGAQLFYRNVDFNTGGFLNAREDFLSESPEAATTVADVYAYARAWALDNPGETRDILAKEAGITPEVAEATLERTQLDIEQGPSDDDLTVLRRIAPALVDTGDVSDQSQVDEALSTIVDGGPATKPDPERVRAAIEESAS